MQRIHRKVSNAILGILLAISSIANAGPFSSVARAPSGTHSSDFILEPALGISSGTIKQTGNADLSTQAINAEARFGYRLSSFNFGLSYLMGFGSAQQYSNKGDFTTTDLGIFLGYDLPWSLYLVGGYIFSAKAKIEKSENPSDFSGVGYKMGLGWAGFSWASFVLEGVTHEYTSYGGTKLSNSLKDSSLNLSMSFPLL